MPYRTRNGPFSFETRHRETRPTLALYTEHNVFGLIPHHLEDRAHGGGVIQDIYWANMQVEYSGYIVRTPILLLPHCIFFLIRRKMPSVRCEYFINLIQSSLLYTL